MSQHDRTLKSRPGEKSTSHKDHTLHDSIYMTSQEMAHLYRELPAVGISRESDLQMDIPNL